MKRTMLILLVAMLLASPSRAAGSTEVIEGDGVITCQIKSTLFYAVNCAGEDEANGLERLEPGAYAWVEFTVTWTPNSQETERLQLELSGDWVCGDQPQNGIDRSCAHEVAVGSSPLTVRLEGPAVQDITIYAALSAEDCIGCASPPVSVIRDLPYHFTWTVGMS